MFSCRALCALGPDIETKAFFGDRNQRRIPLAYRVGCKFDKRTLKVTMHSHECREYTDKMRTDAVVRAQQEEEEEKRLERKRRNSLTSCSAQCSIF
jgi:hypothetical protein